MSNGRLIGSRTDSELVGAARQGDKPAFAELVGRHRATALALSRRMLRDREAAGDTVQEAIVVAMLSLDRLREPERFGAWLCGIALNIARRSVRQTNGKVSIAGIRPVSDEVAPDEHAEAADVAARVRLAVSELPPGQHDAVLLFYLQGLTHREVAAELGISIGAVKARLHQARSALAPRLASFAERQQEVVMTETTPSEWLDVTIEEVRRSGSDEEAIGHPHVAVLRETGGDRRLPIWIGPAEGIALALSLESAEMPRPMTYQFAAGLLTTAGARLVEVRITRLAEGTYYAVVIIDGSNGHQELDARPSDAINIAVIAGAPVKVDAGIFELRDATRHTAWQDYPDTTSDVVADALRRFEEQMAALAREREESADS